MIHILAVCMKIEVIKGGERKEQQRKESNSYLYLTCLFMSCKFDSINPAMHAVYPSKSMTIESLSLQSYLFPPHPSIHPSRAFSLLLPSAPCSQIPLSLYPHTNPCSKSHHCLLATHATRQFSSYTPTSLATRLLLFKKFTHDFCSMLPQSRR